MHQSDHVVDVSYRHFGEAPFQSITVQRHPNTLSRLLGAEPWEEEYIVPDDTDKPVYLGSLGLEPVSPRESRNIRAMLESFWDDFPTAAELEAELPSTFEQLVTRLHRTLNH